MLILSVRFKRRFKFHIDWRGRAGGGSVAETHSIFKVADIQIMLYNFYIGWVI